MHRIKPDFETPIKAKIYDNAEFISHQHEEHLKIKDTNRIE